MAKTTSSVAVVDDNPNKIGIKEGMGYMFGDAANLLVLTFVSSFLKVFYTDVLKIDASQIAILFLVTRLWDAVNDPMWGFIVAKRKPRPAGKFRPYIRTVAFPLALSTVFCFLNFTSCVNNDTLVLALAYITYTAFGMLYTGMNVPFGSLASVITDDPKGRTLLSTFRSIGGGIGGGIVSIIAPMVVYIKTNKTDAAGNLVRDASGKVQTINVTSAKGMLIFAIIISAFAVVFYQLCYKGTKERIKSSEQPDVNMKETYLGMFKSRPFISVALAGILISGQLQFASYNQYLYKNYFENTNLSIVGTIANYLPMAIMIFFMPKLVEKFGKKELCGIGTILSAAAAIAVAIIQPNRNQAWLFMLFLFLIGFGYSFVSITNWAVVADVIDYQEYKTHQRGESAIYAVYTFSRKLGQTIADAGGVLLLNWAGYTSENAGMGYVPGVGEKLMIICTVIPAIVYTLVFILMQFAYPLSKKNLEPIYEYHRKIRESNATQMQETDGTSAEETDGKTDDKDNSEK